MDAGLDTLEALPGELNPALVWVADQIVIVNDAAAAAQSAIGAANYQGDYDAGTEYTVGLSVSFGGTVFSAKKTNLGIEPVDGADWLELGSGDVNSTLALTAGTGLTGGGDLTEDRTFAIDAATAANIRAGTADKVITADGVEAACVLTTPSGASNYTPDWSSFIVADWAITSNRTLSNPTNVEPGTTRYVFIRATGGSRTITFGSNYKGDLPTLDDVGTAKWYLLSLVAYSTTHIVVASIVAEAS